MIPRPKIPRRGSIAICGKGYLGLITQDSPQKISYGDGTTSMAYVGIHLRHEQYEEFVASGVPYEKGEVKKVEIKVGDKWSSRSPRVVGHIEDLDLMLRAMALLGLQEQLLR